MVQSFRTIREDEVSRLITELRSSSSPSSSHDEELVNLSALTLAFTSTLICRIAFGGKSSFDNNNNKKRFDEILLESQAMMGGFFITDIFPCLSWVDNLSGKISRLNKNFKELDLFYQELIQEHVNHPYSPKSMKNIDVLDLLIQLKQEQHSSSPAVNFTWDHVKALLMDIFIGGTDTTAATIVWTMTALMKNPSELQRLQAEIRDFAGNKGGIIKEEEIQQLSYLKAVVKEAMRMYPPVPLLIPRETSEKCTIIEGYRIEPKTIVYFNAWAIGRDPECWENPEEFLPERFLDRDDNKGQQHFGPIPFGAGRRGCPGVSLALATVELALANLVYSFDWELPHGMKHEDIDTDASPGITMHKKDALCLVPKQYIYTL